MTVKLQYSGKTVEEAIDKACRNLNAAREDLNIKVITPGSKGFLGFGRRQAQITAAPKNNGSESITAPQDKPATTEADTSSATTQRQTGRKFQKDQGPAYRGSRQEPAQPDSAEIIEITTVVKEIIGLMGLKAEVEATVVKNRIKAVIDGPDNELIIGRRGETIDAIQYLVRKIISHKFPHKLFFALDVGNYRSQRREELEKLALELAVKVKSSGITETIAAMNPAERRIVHLALQNDREIRSVSMGDGLFKKIRIYVPSKKGGRSAKRR
ncbi:RNA-binding protein Jag [hydrothermal vent metagenome]|uniref:RNA-binding protein Jag n=1 Tax=hydrothermal vent metagenome TaxID=652676 RepID=A0A3B0UY18_9ZZZZ